jgi:deaminated glutathione amidase
MLVRSAVIQMTPGADKAQNWAAAERWIAQAATAGAQWVSLPETFVYSGSHRPEIMQSVAESIPGLTSRLLSQWAKQYRIYLIGGSFFEINPQDLARPFNTCLVYGPEGELLATYRKNHLFTLKTASPGDATARNLSESAYQTQGKPGDRSVAITPLGNVGLSICYDLRFPDLYQYYSRECGATLLAVPSKFLKTTGEAHWLPLLQARAIENQCFVLAANAYSETQPSNYGHSMILDPWGKVLAQLTTGEGFCCADLDFAYLAQVRERLPVHAHADSCYPES